MKALVLTAFLACPALAEETPPPDQGDQGMSLMQQGAEMLLRHMMSKVDPGLEDMAQALKEAQPNLMKLMALIDDIKNYHAPEVLQNGDILIRRKTPAELQPKALPEGGIDL